MRQLEVMLDFEFEVFGRDDDVGQVAVFVGEVAVGAVEAIHFPVDAREVEVADAALRQDTVHLELDAL